MSLGVNADDRLGVGFAQVYPRLGEIYFHSVDVGDFLRLVTLFHRVENRVYINFGGELNLVLGDGISRITGFQFGHFLAAFGHECEEQRHPYEGVASVMGLRIYYPAIAFSANHRASLFHFGDDIHLTDGGG